ncbi:hypothetical protein B0H10DRAFT_1999303 [Mycena sp. CBHHK59/15]|nr:hypothetical protein B0H10DRAFT_1999303 [Mycena sp. CBHHK59/15]
MISQQSASAHGRSVASSPTPTLTVFTKRRRVYIACTNCRRRKIKCMTSKEGPNDPCNRCYKNGLL